MKGHLLFFVPNPLYPPTSLPVSYTPDITEPLEHAELHIMVQIGQAIVSIVQ